ncbi:sulfotransferase [Streptosporangium fragile]|uniref:Sulfotransferase n=1 Tax=Streptosporangium fragile TaxID=46186 RepID=A0ABN3W7Y7_9ACTN
MNWQRKANDALVRLTGFQINRVGKAGSAARPAPAPPAEEAFRPPADPAADRLLVAPVFVLSPVRSGSTLLRALLNAHSMLHAPHELHVRRLRVEFGTSLAERAMEALGHNRADLEHLLWDRVLHRELVRSGKTVVVDKTPANAFAYKRIAACWPDARFVFLLRHPASIARSWYEAGPDRRTPDEAALDALRYMKAVERARGALTGCTVRYEDLTADPETETRRVCDFLGVPWEPGMLSYGEQAVLSKGLGDWKDKIRSGSVQPGRELPDPEKIPRSLRPICESWGYLPGGGGPT